MLFLAWVGKSFKDRKIEHLSIQTSVGKSVILSLIGKLEEVGHGIGTWPSDKDHNIIRLGLSDLKILEEPFNPAAQFVCSECGVEIPQHLAKHSKKAKCNSCYMVYKREQRVRR